MEHAPLSSPAVSSPGAAAGWSVWLLAARPKTLPAAVAPVIVGAAVAVHAGGFHLLSAILALVTALLLQIAANFANDAFDFRKGADTTARTGPTRVTASGLVSPDTMIRATVLALAAAMASGAFLAWRGGWPILVLGVAAVICAVAYTGGPYPLGYLGLGEVFVFAFFGVAAVTGTAYVQAQALTWPMVAAAVPVGAWAVGILVVNNLRDLPEDAAAGKRTIAVRIGAAATRREYRALLVMALAAPFVFWALGWIGPWALLTLASWPGAVLLWRQVGMHAGAQLNATLALTGRTQLIYCLGLGLAFVMGAS